MPEPKFEEALKRLEEIVEDLEGGDLSLDESLAKYEEGVKLSVLCAGKLEAAKRKIEVLIKEGEDKYSLKPFDTGLEDVAIKKGRTRRGRRSKEEDSLF